MRKENVLCELKEARELIEKYSAERLKAEAGLSKSSLKWIDERIRWFTDNKYLLTKELTRINNKEQQLESKAKRAKREGYPRSLELVDEIKRELSGQYKIYPYCPYCQKGLGYTPHADHIYPVSLGGLTTIKNMVYICTSCNLKKAGLTLRDYVRKYNLNMGAIEVVLKKLNKEF